MSTVLVEVTKQHITRGFPSNADLCPLALAIGEITKRRVLVIPGRFRFAGTAPDYRDYESVYRNLPEEAEAFRQRFDKKESVEPFAFQIEVGQEARREVPEHTYQPHTDSDTGN